MTAPTTFDDLYKAVEQKEITAVIDNAGTKKRLFIATNGALCYFAPRRSRSGFRLFQCDMLEFKTYIFKAEPKSTEETLKKKYDAIAKYKKLAEKATFSNSFITDCKNIPSFEDWKVTKAKDIFNESAEPQPKGLYELGITTGNKIDGRVVSISRIAKQYPHYAQMLREAIKTQSESHICSHVPFAGYEMSLSTAKKEVGEFIGYLSLEYKNCGNGYYYLLINDDNFIGYDVD